MAASQQFTRLQQGFDSFGNPILGAIPQSNYIDALVFSGSGAGSDTIPNFTDSDGVTWTPNFVALGLSTPTAMYMNFGSSISVPSANITNGTAPEAQPVIRQVPKGATQVNIAVGAACVVTLSYFL